MPSMKAIKRRILSVSTTKKIMKAMNMVSASKLQKNKVKLKEAESFFIEVEKIINSIFESEIVKDNIFLSKKEVKNIAYLVITADRGLCGSYNTNVIVKTISHIAEFCEQAGVNEKIVVVGLKGQEQLKREGKNIIYRYDDVLETAFYEDAQRISEYLINLYKIGEADEIYLAYTQFDSVLVHLPKIEKLLPIDIEFADVNKVNMMKYEPDEASFLEDFIPVYLSSSIYYALLQSATCEQAARMASMDTAVKNAGEIIDKLTHSYNYRRQSAITQEISEVVSSTNILNAKE